MPLREFTGAAIQVRLTGTLTAGELTSFTVDQSTNGYPTGGLGPFVVVVDAGTASEEKILVQSRAGATFSGLTRGFDGTTAVQHSAQAVVEHVLSAETIQEANLHVNDDTRDDHSQYLNVARHDIPGRHQIGVALPTAAQFAAAILPVGMITAYGGSSAPTNWLLCDGAAIPAEYVDLIALVGPNTPNLKGRVIAGINAAETEFDTRFETGGAKTHTLTLAQVPSHSHTINDHTHGGTTGNENSSLSHGHSADDNWTGEHQHIVNAGGHEVAFLFPGANGKLSTTGNAEGITFSDINPAGGHDHNISVSANGPGAHTHNFTTGGASNRGTDSQGGGGSHPILPPYMALHYIIKAA